MKKLNVLVYDSISEEVLNFLKESYDVNLIKYTKDGPTSADLILLNGEQSGDVNPEKYSELTGKFTDVKESFWERYEYLRGMFGQIPILGIEDGAEFISVHAGGTMIQHVRGHKESHGIEIVGSSKTLTAPSNHHQMMYPYDLPDDKYKVHAWSRYFQSNTYLTGKNEEKALANNFLEPEIISFNNRSFTALAIQGNPAKGDSLYKSYCMKLIGKLINKRI